MNFRILIFKIKSINFTETQMEFDITHFKDSEYGRMMLQQIDDYFNM